MRKIRFLFFDNPGIGSLAIKVRLGTTLTHCGIDFGKDGFYHSSGFTGMCRDDHYTKHHVIKGVSEIYVPEDKYQAALTLCRSKVGQRYDFKALLGFVIVKKFEDADALFCSEIGRLVMETATSIELHWSKLCAPHELKLMVDTYAAMQKRLKGLDL
jgi:hypothetical protein